MFTHSKKYFALHTWLLHRAGGWYFPSIKAGGNPIRNFDSLKVESVP
jgi:hypothetical protein